MSASHFPNGNCNTKGGARKSLVFLFARQTLFMDQMNDLKADHVSPCFQHTHCFSKILETWYLLWERYHSSCATVCGHADVIDVFSCQLVGLCEVILNSGGQGIEDKNSKLNLSPVMEQILVRPNIKAGVLGKWMKLWVVLGGAVCV